MNKLILKGRGMLLLLMSLVLVSACDKDDDEDIDVDILTEQEFVTRAAANNLFEIESSELALNNAETDTVISFANKMIADHTQASTELMAIADDKNLTVPTTLPQDKQQIINDLADQMGISFDKSYMDAQEAAHVEAVTLFELAAEDLEDQELRQFAEEMLPVLKMHLEMAEDIDDITDDL